MEDSVDHKNKLDVKKLYDPQSLEIMRVTENALEKGSNRLKGIENFAKTAGIKSIGIAHCIAFTKEAEAIKKFLHGQFEVHTIDCKCGRMNKQEMLGVEGNGLMCNPAGQAKILEDANTELNISIGLCVGHDMIFNYKSNVPVTTLIVKDRTNKHNPMEILKNLSIKGNEDQQTDPK